MGGLKFEEWRKVCALISFCTALKHQVTILTIDYYNFFPTSPYHTLDAARQCRPPARGTPLTTFNFSIINRID